MNNRYASGANFEHRIIHDLLNMNALLVMRGAGSKSYGSIKADIIALFPSGILSQMGIRLAVGYEIV